MPKPKRRHRAKHRQPNMARTPARPLPAAGTVLVVFAVIAASMTAAAGLGITNDGTRSAGADQLMVGSIQRPSDATGSASKSRMTDLGIHAGSLLQRHAHDWLSPSTPSISSDSAPGLAKSPERSSQRPGKRYQTAAFRSFPPGRRWEDYGKQRAANPPRG